MAPLSQVPEWDQLPNVNPFFLLGVLNSEIIDWYYRSIISEEGRAFAEVKIAVLKQLPIPSQVANSLIDEISLIVKDIVNTLRKNPFTKIEDKQKRVNRLVETSFRL